MKLKISTVALILERNWSGRGGRQEERVDVRNLSSSVSDRDTATEGGKERRRWVVRSLSQNRSNDFGGTPN